MDKVKATNLKAFMQPITRDIVDFVASARFMDENGNPVPWQIRPISAEENNALMKACTRNMPVPGKRGMYAPEVDYALYSTKLSVACTVFPPLGNTELQNAHGIVGEDALFSKLLLLGEQARYGAKVREVNGFDDDLDGLVDDAKN